MATKAEMRVEIEELARAQGVDVTPEDLDRMNHPDMASLLEAFKAQAATADEEAPVSSDDDVEPEPETPAPLVESEPETPAPSTDSPLTAPPTVTAEGTDDKSLGGPPPKGGVKQRWPYAVASGRSVTTSRRGTIGAFAPVRASDFSGGQEQLDELVASGYVTRKA